VTSFVVETYVPDGNAERFAADVDGIRAVLKSGASAGGAVRHVRSFLVPSDAMGFHVIQADSADDIARVAELARIEVERIVATVGIGPDDGAGTTTSETEGGKS
jgi:hypothetical protein